MKAVGPFFTDLWSIVKADAINAAIVISNIVSGIFANIDSIATTLGDPSIVHQLPVVVHDTQKVAIYIFGVTVLAAVARFKKLVQSPPKA